MDWVQIVQSVGVPATLLAGVGYSLYQAGSYLGPRLSAVLESHLQLIDHLDKQVLLQTRLIESQNKILEENTAILREIHGTVVRRGAERVT